ncbi:MAG: SDR family NAD(P)-dependent oxidoreductase, partial [Pyrinomonadaceae bacterium]|nr:SDR family NAD(P)-dependent oxidoreductase [Pyrinomonadaceae bacterium]
MDLGLKGKVAFVAAASRGLGRAVAEELAAEGTSLILCARNAETLNLVSKQIAQTSNVSVFPVVADVSNEEDVAAAVKAGIEKFGRIDILVTNAGGPPAGQFETLSREMWEAATRLTLNSVLELTRA